MCTQTHIAELVRTFVHWTHIRNSVFISCHRKSERIHPKFTSKIKEKNKANRLALSHIVRYFCVTRARLAFVHIYTYRHKVS